MAYAVPAWTSLADYLAMDNASELRNEYIAGLVEQKESGTERHNRIGGNIAHLLHDGLEGSACGVVRVRLEAPRTGRRLRVLPGRVLCCVHAVCDGRTMLDDATLVVEVLSDSTAATDRREKLLAYRKLPGLRAYWMVSQNEQRVEVHTRAGSDWQVMAYTAGDAIPAGWLEGEAIALARIYAGTAVA